MKSSDLILVSGSPRRAELLRQIGVGFRVRPVDIDETPRLDEEPDHFVKRMAWEKAEAGFDRDGTGKLLLAADTAVIADGRIMGKPRDEQDAGEMLGLLSGRTHQVFSAVSLRGNVHRQALSKSEVTFRKIDREEIRQYWLTGEPQDKAGGYAIQGLGAIFIERIEGSYSGVMGLPVFETAQLLQAEGLIWYE